MQLSGGSFLFIFINKFLDWLEVWNLSCTKRLSSSFICCLLAKQNHPLKRFAVSYVRNCTFHTSKPKNETEYFSTSPINHSTMFYGNCVYFSYYLCNRISTTKHSDSDCFVNTQSSHFTQIPAEKSRESKKLHSKPTPINITVFYGGRMRAYAFYQCICKRIIWNWTICGISNAIKCI